MPEQVKELYYVKDGALYHKGPGRVYVREIDKANLYPQPVARKIAQLYGCTMSHYFAEIQERILDHQLAINELQALRSDITQGMITYERPSDDLVALWDMGADIRAMPEGPLKSQLLKILEEHMAAACQEARQG